MAALRKELLIAKAFTRTPKVLPDVPPPESGGESVGFIYSSYGAEPAWSTCTSHGRGPAIKPNGGRRSGSQNSKHLFSTPVLALKAYRNSVEQECAEKLAKIDDQIAKEGDFL